MSETMTSGLYINPKAGKNMARRAEEHRAWTRVDEIIASISNLEDESDCECGGSGPCENCSRGQLTIQLDQERGRIF
jgi:hypothetical protein